MQHTRFAALVASLRAMPSRRTVLTTFLGGLPGLFLMAGPDEVVAKGKNNRRKHRKRRRPCRASDKPGKGCRCQPAGARCTADANCCPSTQHLSCQEGACQPCDVCQEGCAFSSVQAAIDAAVPGGTVHLCSGVFDSGDFKGSFNIGKDLTLIGVGEGKGGTTLDGRGHDSTVRVLNFATLTLERLRITGGRGGEGGGIFSQSSTVALTACTVSGNTAISDGGGISALEGRVILKESTVADNEAGETGGGSSSVSMTAP